MAFPIVAGVGRGNSGAQVTTHTVTFDQAPVAGEAILIDMAFKHGTASITPPAGWTHAPDSPAGTSTFQLIHLYRVCDGSEGSSINITTSSACGSAYQARRIKGHGLRFAIGGTGFVHNGNTGTSVSPFPGPTHNDGTKDMLWIAAFAILDGTVTVSAYPSSYTDGILDRWNNANGIGIASAVREVRSSSQTPGAATLSASTEWGAYTWMVHPALPSPIASFGSNTANPTTTSGMTIPSEVLAGDDIYIALVSRDHTSGNGFPTVTDNDSGGNTWSRIAESSDRKATLWHKKATSGTAGKTVTYASAIGSSVAVGIVVAYGHPTTPHSNISVEDNASANETHAGFTPAGRESLIFLAVFNTGNDNTVTSMACTDPGSLTTLAAEDLSTGGNDSAVRMAARGQRNTTPQATGSFTWAQVDGTTKSIVWAVRGDVRVEPSGIPSGEAHGSLTITVSATGNISPTGIASAEAHGATKINQQIRPGSVTSAEAHGSTKINRSVVPTGIPTAEAHGSPRINLKITPTGIPSAEAHGSTRINRVVSPSSIPSGELHGSTKINLKVSPSGIASAEALGNPSITTAAGPITISPTGISSAEAHGSTRINRTISPGSIASLEAHGLARLNLQLRPGSVPTGEAHGSTTITVPPGAQTISPAGIPSAEVHGSTRIQLRILPTGIASLEVHGVARLNLQIRPGGIASGEAHGSTSVRGQMQTISPNGVASLEAHGGLTITVGSPPGPPPILLTPRRGPPLIGNRVRERAAWRTMIRR